MNNFNFQKIQKQFVNKFRNLYSLITKNNIRVFFFIFAIVILTRLPWLILITSDDPGDDSAFYINIAENIVDGDGYVTDFKEVYYESDSVEKIEIENQAFWILPGYSFFLALIFIFNDSVYFAKVVQTLLFSLLIDEN